MSSFTFEGDLQGTTKPQLDYISEILKKRGNKGSKLVFEPVGKAGDNYIACVKRISVNEDSGVLKLVVKFPPLNPQLRAAANIGQMFKNEHIMYTKILPKFDQKQKSAGVPKNEQFRFAKCYGSSNAEPNEVILLEDLKEDNFAILSRFEPFSYETVKLVLRDFGMYHALSFATRYLEPETYAEFQKCLAPNWELEMNEEQFGMFGKMIETQAIECSDARCERFLKGAISSFTSLEKKIRKQVKNSKYTVIQMGDAWTNNIMLRHENDVAVECVLVDYQLVRENSPVFDLMYMLFNSTSHEDRIQHFHEYIDYYHSELEKALQNFGLKANFVYPKDRLDADLKSYGKLMFAQSIISAFLSTKKADEAQKMKDAMEQHTDAEVDEATLAELNSRDDESLNMFRIRVEGLVDSFSAFGFI